MEIVRLGISAAASVPRYRGTTTATSWPCATSAFGSASTTSARPPVFENGSPSDATNKILMNGPFAECTPILRHASALRPASFGGLHGLGCLLACSRRHPKRLLRPICARDRPHRNCQPVRRIDRHH